MCLFSSKFRLLISPLVYHGDVNVACCPNQLTLSTELLDLQASHSAFCALLVDGAGTGEAARYGI